MDKVADKPKNKGGRPKGAQNKRALKVKDAMVKAFDMAGGPLYLFKLSETHPAVFASLLSKFIPAVVEVDVQTTVVHLVDSYERLRALEAERAGIEAIGSPDLRGLDTLDIDHVLDAPDGSNEPENSDNPLAADDMTSV